MKLIVYTDGASRGNPGHSSYGFVVYDANGRVIHDEGRYIGLATNNMAEYTAAMQSLERILEKFPEPNLLEINFNMDSQLLVRQLSGKYKIKSPSLKIIFDKIKQLEKFFLKVSYHHIPREKNHYADKLANLALDKRKLSPNPY